MCAKIRRCSRSPHRPYLEWGLDLEIGRLRGVKYYLPPGSRVSAPSWGAPSSLSHRRSRHSQGRRSPISWRGKDRAPCRRIPSRPSPAGGGTRIRTPRRCLGSTGGRCILERRRRRRLRKRRRDAAHAMVAVAERDGGPRRGGAGHAGDEEGRGVEAGAHSGAGGEDVRRVYCWKTPTQPGGSSRAIAATRD